MNKILLSALLSAAALCGSGTQPEIRSAEGGAVTFDNGVVQFDLAGQTGTYNGVTRLLLLPSTEMSDRNRPLKNFFGEHFDACDTEGVQGGSFLPHGAVLAPLARGVSKDGSAVGIRQEYSEKYRFTRTVTLRNSRSVADFDYEAENLSGEPVAGAFRIFSAPFPGALTGTTDKSTSVFLPTVAGILELDQNVHSAKYKEIYKDTQFFLPLWDTGKEPPRVWTRRQLETPRLAGNWVCEVNRNNGFGVVFFADESSLVGFYNDPRTTVEIVLRAHAYRKGEVFKARLALGVFRLPKGEKPVAANPLFITTQQGIVPLFTGTLEVDGKSYPAEPTKQIDIKPAGTVRALDTEKRIIGTFDGAKFKITESEIEYIAPKKPSFQDNVYNPDSAEVSRFTESRNFTVYCNYANHPDIRGEARAIALRLGAGYAEHLPDTPILMIGAASDDDSIRAVGYMHNSVTDKWPDPGKGAIRFFPKLDLNGQPGVVIAGRDREGLAKAFDSWKKQNMERVSAAKGWTVYAVPTLEKIFRWARPGKDAKKTIQLSAAKGEYESAQLLLVPYSDILNVSITATPFLNVKTDKELSPRFLTSAQKRNGHLRIRWTGFFPYSPNPEQKDYPDPLFDRVPAVIKAGEAQSVWLTFFVPESAEAGIYRATVSVSGNGKTENIPVELNVRDFTMPREGMWGEAYSSLGAMAPAGMELRNDQIEIFVTNQVEHGMRMIRITAPNLFRIHGDPKGAYPGLSSGPFEASSDGRILLDSTEFDRIIDISERAGKPYTLYYTVPIERFMREAYELKKILPGRHADRVGNALLNNRYLEEVLVLFRKHLERKNLNGRIFLGVSDEPGNIKVWFDNLCQAALGSGIPFTTAHGSSDLREADPKICAIWKPIYGSYDEDFMKKAKAAGVKTAFYNCGPPPTTAIGAPGCEWRNYLWQAAKYDLDMVSWWGIQCWTSYDADGKESLWRNYYGHWNYLIYPEHPVNKPFYTKQGGWRDKGFIDSIRWETIRDGMEDASYVKLLRSLIDKARKQGKTAEADDAQKKLDDLFARCWPHRNVYRVPENEILSAREAVADEIEKLQKVLH